MIKDRESANKYYGIVNGLINKYINDWNIRPTSLKSYLKPGNKNYNNFLKNNNLNEVVGIDRVIHDVIEDKCGMELDQLIKFESFILNEGLLSTEPPKVEHQKVLADFYNTSLGHIKVIDQDIHLFEVSDFGKIKKCIIYSEEEVSKISATIEDKLYEEFVLRKLNISSINNVKITQEIDILLSEVISEEKFKSLIKTKLTKEKLINLIANIIKPNVGTNFIFNELHSGYYIWQEKPATS